MKNIQISPSILSADFSQLGSEIKRLEEGGADMIHVDVMDGHFVPNLTIGPPVIKALRKHCSLKFDVHLMISPVHKYMEAYADAGADIITIHPEATDNLENSMKKINSEEFQELIKNPQIVILDTRSSKDFIKSHIKDSIFIGLEGRFAPWVGEIFKDINTPMILVCNEGRQKEAITRLSRIGFDNCLGFLDGGIKKWIRDGNETESLETLNSKNFIDILKLNKIDILDVRRESEFKNKHIEGAINIPLSNLKEKAQDIKQSDNLYIHLSLIHI